MFRSWPPGKPGAGQIERAPEEMGRARLADEPAPKLLEHPIGMGQDPPATVGIFRVVRAVLLILGEWSRVLHLIRRWPEPGLDPQFLEQPHVLAIEVSY
jgi:hypothetical protein